MQTSFLHATREKYPVGRRMQKRCPFTHLSAFVLSQLEMRYCDTKTRVCIILLLHCVFCLARSCREKCLLYAWARTKLGGTLDFYLTALWLWLKQLQSRRQETRLERRTRLSEGGLFVGRHDDPLPKDPRSFLVRVNNIDNFSEKAVSGTVIFFNRKNEFPCHISSNEIENYIPKRKQWKSNPFLLVASSQFKCFLLILGW